MVKMKLKSIVKNVIADTGAGRIKLVMKKEYPV